MIEAPEAGCRNQLLQAQVFSVIEDNHIHHINKMMELGGAPAYWRAWVPRFGGSARLPESTECPPAYPRLKGARKPR
jgi:hypothetical protein